MRPRVLLLPAFLGIMGCEQTLLQDLPETEANELVAELALAGIRGSKSAGRAGQFVVEVASQDETKAWAVAKAAGFPRARTPPDAQRLVLGPRASEALERRRKAHQLSALLRKRVDVVDAQVVLDPAGAAVLVRIRAGDTVDRAALIGLVRAGAGLGAQAEVKLDIAIIDHSGADSTSVGRPTWPLRLTSMAAIGLSLICLLLLRRLRQNRRQERGRSPQGR